MRVRLLGAVAAVDAAGDEVPVRGQPAAVLAALALSPQDWASTDRLADAVWGDDSPATAANALQVYVAQLRRLLGKTAISTRRGGYRLTVRHDEVDALLFTRLTDAGARALREGGLDQARELLRAALELWRGPALGSLADREWFVPHATRLQEARLTALELRLEAELAAGQGQALVAEVEALVRDHPYRERLHAARVRALHQGGRRADALAAYQQARQLLDDELGIDPGPQLRAAHAAVLADDVETVPVRPDLTVVGLQRPPAPVTALLGRDRELQQVAGLLRTGQTRMVTITGPGGVGKTVLATAVAHELDSEFDDGVRWAARAR